MHIPNNLMMHFESERLTLDSILIQVAHHAIDSQSLVMAARMMNLQNLTVHMQKGGSFLTRMR